MIVTAMLLTGCSTAMVPVGANRAAGPLAVDVIVGQDFPHFYRSDPYTPVHITFRNNSPKKVQLKHSYFTLVDPGGHEFVIAPIPRVMDWLKWNHWHRYARYYPTPIGRYVFREGRLSPGAEMEAVMFFHQATRWGQGTYTLRAAIPNNTQPVEFKFRLK